MYSARILREICNTRTIFTQNEDGLNPDFILNISLLTKVKEHSLPIDL